jgi:1-phosphatidylinositol-4-phosphate 5-kinase
MGIIDTLTGYGGIKKVEHFGKSIVYDSKTISCIPPVAYGDRFYEFMANQVFVE